jgi:hypothetical protein
MQQEISQRIHTTTHLGCELEVHNCISWHGREEESDESLLLNFILYLIQKYKSQNYKLRGEVVNFELRLVFPVKVEVEHLDVFIREHGFIIDWLIEGPTWGRTTIRRVLVLLYIVSELQTKD